MQTVFITGDRSIPADAALGLVALTMLKEITKAGGVNGSNGVEFATGQESGVEAAVRFAAEKSGISLKVFETPVINAEGHKDFGLRAQNVAAEADTLFLILHADPHSSRITSQMLAVLDPAAVEIVHPALV